MASTFSTDLTRLLATRFIRSSIALDSVKAVSITASRHRLLTRDNSSLERRSRSNPVGTACDSGRHDPSVNIHRTDLCRPAFLMDNWDMSPSSAQVKQKALEIGF